MSTKLILEYAKIFELTVAVGFVLLLWRKNLLREFPLLAALASAHALIEAFIIPSIFFRKAIGLNVDAAFRTYYLSTWIGFFIQAILYVLILHQVYTMAMRPLQGLKRIGSIIFRWVAVVSAVVSVSLTIGPNPGTSSYFEIIAERLQQGLGALTLCLLLFVCFAIRPLGLTYRSRIFGITLGLGVLSTANFVEAAWYTSSGSHSAYAPFYLVGASGWLVASMIWGSYFAMPEPERRMVLLPTTSPFFLWNRVSEALGDNPGYVAVAGFEPHMLDPAELTVLTAASIASKARLANESAEQAEAAAQTSFAAQNPFANGTLHSLAIPH